jgi:hypothetical protein
METLGSNKTAGGGKRYQDVAAGNADFNRFIGPRPEPGSRRDMLRMTATNTAAGYLDALRPVSEKKKSREQDSSLTSLAPEEPGALRDLILEGERHFRLKKYRQAVNRFKMAEDMSMGSPESMLSLMHTYFAASYDSYSMPAYYLRKTLKVFPELPKARIHPKAFYGDTAVYIDDLLRLKNHVREKPADHEAKFVLAYLEWRDDNFRAAQSLLRAVMENSDSAKVSEAVGILWDGMVATGRVSGELMPATRPATQPAAKP